MLDTHAVPTVRDLVLAIPAVDHPEPAGFPASSLTITLRRSKTDQQAMGRKIGIPNGSNPETCPVRSVQNWKNQAGIGGGPLFRSINRHGQVQLGRLNGIDVARVVKKL